MSNEHLVNLFVSYSHRDKRFRRKLEDHLAFLRRCGLIADWHDREIAAGDEWESEIDRHLLSADIVLLLVTADFIASDYCWSEEMKKVLERHQRGEARVIPVILSPCLWGNTPFGGLQAVPKDARPVTSWPSPDEAFEDVAVAIERAIEDMRGKSHREGKRYETRDHKFDEEPKPPEAQEWEEAPLRSKRSWWDDINKTPTSQTEENHKGPAIYRTTIADGKDWVEGTGDTTEDAEADASRKWHNRVKGEKKQLVVKARALKALETADELASEDRLGEALHLLRNEALPAIEQIGDIVAKAATLGRIAEVLQARVELDEALRILREVLAIYEQVGDRAGTAMTYHRAGQCLLLAQRLRRRALLDLQVAGDRGGARRPAGDGH